MSILRGIPNWNGYYGAVTFSDEDISLYENILNDLILYPTKIYPTNKNSIYMKYDFKGVVVLDIVLFVDRVDIQATINKSLDWIWNDTFEYCNKSFKTNLADNINKAVRECMLYKQLYNQSMENLLQDVFMEKNNEHNR